MHLRHCPHHVINNLTICNEISRAYAFAATTQTPSFVGNYIHKPMEKKTTLIALLCLLLAVIITPTAVTAQSDLTPEESTFLKSLNGKWSPKANDSSEWGSWIRHFTIKCVGEKIKISYPDYIMNGHGVFKVGTAYYDTSYKRLRFSYTSKDYDIEGCNTFDVSISIPFQDDIEDMMLVNYTWTFAGVTNTCEEIYYKR